VGALNIHASFVIPLLFPSDQNCSKDLQTATPESILTKYVQIGPSHQKC